MFHYLGHSRSDLSATPSVKLSDVTCLWTKTSSDGPLYNVSIDLHGNKLLAVTGSVGSGKSSLLHAISGEILVAAGKVQVEGKISYVSQSAWIFSGTVRDNILFGNEFKEEKYQRVINACALKDDMTKFP